MKIIRQLGGSIVLFWQIKGNQGPYEDLGPLEAVEKIESDRYIIKKVPHFSVRDLEEGGDLLSHLVWQYHRR